MRASGEAGRTSDYGVLDAVESMAALGAQQFFQMSPAGNEVRLYLAHVVGAQPGARPRQSDPFGNLEFGRHLTTPCNAGKHPGKLRTLPVKGVSRRALNLRVLPRAIHSRAWVVC